MDKNSILSKFISTQGYKKNSPDKNRPMNVIPSNQITMSDVEFPVIGVDNLGNQIIMQPGQDYTFPGDYVVETPMAQKGGWLDSYQKGSEVVPPMFRKYIPEQPTTRQITFAEYKQQLSKLYDEATVNSILQAKQMTNYKPNDIIGTYNTSIPQRKPTQKEIDIQNRQAEILSKDKYFNEDGSRNKNIISVINWTPEDRIELAGMQAKAQIDWEQLPWQDKAKSIGTDVALAAFLDLGLGAKMLKGIGSVGKNLFKTADVISDAGNVLSKGDDVIKQVDNIPLQKPNDMLNLFKQNEINWLNSEEYIMRKMKATGKSKETIIKEKNEILKQLDRTTINFLDESPDLAKATYSNGKKPNINIFNNNTESNLSALDHETKHAASEQAIRSNDPIIDLFNNPYKKYPVVNTKKWYDYLIPFETNSKWASKAPEQQVISKRVMDNVEYSQGLKRGTKLTEENISKLIDDLNIEIRAGNDKNSDIITMFKAIQNKFGKHESYKIIKDMINNAYSIPTTIGVSAVGATINTSNKQNGGEANWLNKYE